SSRATNRPLNISQLPPIPRPKLWDEDLIDKLKMVLIDEMVILIVLDGCD
nr:hypothetical protein [Tanacetum cinerariifolium]